MSALSRGERSFFRRSAVDLVYAKTPPVAKSATNIPNRTFPANRRAPRLRNRNKPSGSRSGCAPAPYPPLVPVPAVVKPPSPTLELVHPRAQHVPRVHHLVQLHPTRVPSPDVRVVTFHGRAVRARDVLGSVVIQPQPQDVQARLARVRQRPAGGRHAERRRRVASPIRERDARRGVRREASRRRPRREKGGCFVSHVKKNHCIKNHDAS